MGKTGNPSSSWFRDFPTWWAMSQQACIKHYAIVARWRYGYTPMALNKKIVFFQKALAAAYFVKHRVEKWPDVFFTFFINIQVSLARDDTQSDFLNNCTGLPLKAVWKRSGCKISWKLQEFVNPLKILRNPLKILWNLQDFVKPPHSPLPTLPTHFAHFAFSRCPLCPLCPPTSVTLPTLPIHEVLGGFTETCRVSRNLEGRSRNLKELHELLIKGFTKSQNQTASRPRPRGVRRNLEKMKFAVIFRKRSLHINKKT